MDNGRKKYKKKQLLSVLSISRLITFPVIFKTCKNRQESGVNTTYGVAKNENGDYTFGCKRNIESDSRALVDNSVGTAV